MKNGLDISLASQESLFLTVKATKLFSPFGQKKFIEKRTKQRKKNSATRR